MCKQIVIRVYGSGTGGRHRDISRYIGTAQEMEDFARKCLIKAGDAKELRLWFCEAETGETVTVTDRSGQITHRIEMRGWRGR